MDSIENVASNALTRGRRESKYFVPSTRVGRLAAILDANLGRHSVTHARDNAIVDHWVTTIYFDTPSHHIFHEQAREQHALKLRAREYYDTLDPLTELATHADQAVTRSPWTWLEVKWRENGETRKRRVAVPRAKVPGLLRGEPQDTSDLEAMSPHEIVDVRDAMIRLLGRYGEPLVPDCVVSYRRWAWQDRAETLRVTLDTHLSGYRVDDRIWQLQGPLIRANLGTPAFSLPQAILEIKATDTLAPWIENLPGLCNLSAATMTEFANAPFSKFLRIGHAIHGTL